MFKNLTLKLLSLLAAGLLVVYVNSESSTSQIGIVVPIELTDIPTDKIVVEPITPQAQLLLKGPRFLVAQVPLSPPRIRVNVPPTTESSFVISLKDQYLDLPMSVHLVAVEPAEIEFKLESVGTRVLPVIVPQIGSLREDLTLESATLSPDKVSVTGPKRELEQLAQILTEPIDLREISQSISRELKLRLPSALFKLSAQTSTYSLTVGVRQLERRFDRVNLEKRGVNSANWVVDPAVITIVLSGPQPAVKELKREQVIPYINIEVTDSAGKKPVQVDLPQGVALVSVTPEEVGVKPLTAKAR